MLCERTMGRGHNVVALRFNSRQGPQVSRESARCDVGSGLTLETTQWGPVIKSSSAFSVDLLDAYMHRVVALSNISVNNKKLTEHFRNQAYASLLDDRKIGKLELICETVFYDKNIWKSKIEFPFVITHPSEDVACTFGQKIIIEKTKSGREVTTVGDVTTTTLDLLIGEVLKQTDEVSSF